MPQEVVGQIALPLALIRVQEASADPEFDEEPDVLQQAFDVTIGCSVPADKFGEAAIMGANRGQLASQGMGLLQIEEKLISTLGGLTELDGLKFLLRGKGGAQVSHEAQLGYVAWRSYRFEAMVTGTRFYHPASRFVATGGVGQTVMTWRLPPSRYDYRRMILRRASGSTAPASATAGTGVTLTGTPDGVSATSKTDGSLSAGTYSYSLFAAYDEYGTSSDERYSAAISKTVTVT
jgi:hypothetical protein